MILTVLVSHLVLVSNQMYYYGAFCSGPDYNSLDDDNIESPGACAHILAFFSLILVIIFFPFSLVSSLKVSKLFGPPLLVSLA